MLVVDSDRFKVVLNYLPASVLAGVLVGVVALEFAVAEVDSIDKKDNVGAERKELCAVEFVFVGKLLDNREDVFVEEVVSVNDAVAGVEEMEFDSLKCDGFIAVEKQRHVAATGNALLNQFDGIFQQGFGIATVFSQESFVGFFIEA